MTCSLTADGFPVQNEYGEYFRKYFEHVTSEMGQMHISDSGDIRASADSIPCLRDDHPDFKTHSLIESSLEKWSSRRRFCVTTKGRLAFVPPAAQKDDLICVLYGGEVPYILRRDMDNPVHYVVIGECYVHGIMHGQSLSNEGLRAKQLKLVWDVESYVVSNTLKKEGLLGRP